MTDTSIDVFKDNSSLPPLSKRVKWAFRTLKSIFYDVVMEGADDPIYTMPDYTEHEERHYGDYVFNIYHLPADKPKRVVYLLGGFGDKFLGNVFLAKTLNFFNISLVYGQLPDIGNHIGFMPLYRRIANDFFNKQTRFATRYKNVPSDLWGYSIGGQCLLDAIIPDTTAVIIEDDNRQNPLSHKDIFNRFDGLVMPIAPFLATKLWWVPPTLKKRFHKHAARHGNNVIGSSAIDKVVTSIFIMKGLEFFGPATKLPTLAQTIYLRKEAQAMYDRLKQADIPDDLIGHERLRIVQGGNDTVSNPSLTRKL